MNGQKAVFCMSTAKPKITARRTDELCTGCHLECCFGGAWQSKARSFTQTLNVQGQRGLSGN